MGRQREDMLRSVAQRWRAHSTATYNKTNYSTSSSNVTSVATVNTPRNANKPGIYLKSGAVKNKPEINRIGRLTAAVLIGTFVYFGGQLSSLGAQMLHEYEIFEIPDDDD